MIGKTIGEGAFAKVKEGLHVITGEKVSLLTVEMVTVIKSNFIITDRFHFYD